MPFLVQGSLDDHVLAATVACTADLLRAKMEPPACRAGAEGEEMTGKDSTEVPNMRQRTALQHLSLADWGMVDRLPVSAGEMTLSRLLHHGWIECRGEKKHAAVRLTPAGLKAMRSPI